VAEHIYQQGLRDVWVMTGMEGQAFTSRLEAILDVAAESGADRPLLVECAGPSWADGAFAAASEQIARRGRLPQAIITVSDALAYGVALAVVEAGGVVGRDVAVTGYDDGLFARMFWPPLTTVRMPMADLGRHAASGLMRLLDPTQPPPPEVVLPVELIVRKSSQLQPAPHSNLKANESQP